MTGQKTDSNSIPDDELFDAGATGGNALPEFDVPDHGYAQPEPGEIPSGGDQFAPDSNQFSDELTRAHEQFKQDTSRTYNTEFADDPAERTRKKQKLIKLIGAGVLVSVIGMVVLSSWMKAQEVRAHQGAGELMEEEVVEETPAEPPVEVAPAQPGQLPVTTPAEPAPVPVAAAQVVTETAPVAPVMQPAPVAPAPVAPQIIQQAAQPDPQLYARLDDLNGRLQMQQQQISDMMKQLAYLNSRPAAAVAAPAKPAPVKVAKPKPKPKAPQPVVAVAPVEPAQPVAPVATVTPIDQQIGVIEPVKVAFKPIPLPKDACGEWVVKGAVPGMVWIEKEGRLSSFASGDSIPGVGVVQAIDARNFEVKTKHCTIR